MDGRTDDGFPFRIIDYVKGRKGTATFAFALSPSLPFSVGILTAAAVFSLIIVFPWLLLRFYATGRGNSTDGGTDGDSVARRGGEKERGYYCGRGNARRAPRKKAHNGVSAGGREGGHSVVISVM